MLYHCSIAAGGVRLAIALLACSSLACFAHSRGEMDWDDHPVVNTGAGATILYPGQTAPVYYPGGRATQPGAPGGVSPAGSAPGMPGQGAPSAPQSGASQGSPATAGPLSAGSAPSVQTGPGSEQRGPGSEQRSGSPQPGGMPITMIGGAEQDIDGHLSWKQDPAWMKYLTLPFAVVAAPFKALSDSADEAREPGPALPSARPPELGTLGNAPNPESARPLDYESAMVDQLERELEQRQANQAAPETQAATQGRAGAQPGDSSLSIADELAALQRRPAMPVRPSAPPGTVRTASDPNASPPATGPAADGVVDRDGDGRVDQWIFRENGRVTRVALDETGDGRSNRMLFYDPETQAIARVEEDVDGDGRVDAWTDYEAGHLVRRRGDSDGDGSVDTWSFYDAGVITRHEKDSDGDGFRDRVGFYANGKLVREEQDRDRDGRPDATIVYDERERVSRREEDNDRDGRPDVVSHYEDGRLSRRELIDNGEVNAIARP